MRSLSIEGRLRTFRKTGGVTVIHADLTPSETGVMDALAWLDDEEQTRLNRYRHTGARLQFALCRACLRAVLCRELGCGNEQLKFGASDFGKPFALVDGALAPVSFNVSHSGDHGLIAVVSKGRVGVDVEDRTAPRDMDGLSEAAFSPQEQAELASEQGDEKLRLFFALWTMKEALTKALGAGLFLDMSGFEVPPKMRCGISTGIFQFPCQPSVKWRLENLGSESFAAALAHELEPHDNMGPTP